MHEIEGQHDMHDLWHALHDLCCCFMLCDVHDSWFVLQVAWGWDGTEGQRGSEERGGPGAGGY